MAVLCTEPRLLFIQNPRTGCSALGKLLVETYAGRYVPEDPSRPRGYYKHASLDAVLDAGVIDRAEIGHWLTFAGVRNPFDSIASLYQKRENWSKIPRDERSTRWWARNEKILRQVAFVENHSFEDFVCEYIDGDERPRLGRLARDVDRVVRFERMNDDLAEVLRDAGIADPVGVPQHNPTEGKARYQAYYTPRAREVVARVYRRDLEKFGYDFEGARETAV